jgi:hypothetical protein
LRITALGGSRGGEGVVALGSGVVAPAAKELQGVHVYLSAGVLRTLLVRPGTGAEASFNVNLRAFADEPFCNVGRLSPGNYAVPFSILAGFSAAVFESLRGSQAECGHLCVSIKVTYFRVCTNVTDQHYFVQ